ncbi:MAG: hypothetical protein SWQ30_19630, partial [Thermodesulfobacteriota bacterium]|nr:hypothetical protein [Thermodesulfobacteriota bacterium]
EPLTTQEMRYHRLSLRVNNMAGFLLFVDVTGSPFDNIAQKRRNARLSMLFGTFCHVVYATLGERVHSNASDHRKGYGDGRKEKGRQTERQERSL